jgi:hypothetical protein
VHWLQKFGRFVLALALALSCTANLSCFAQNSSAPCTRSYNTIQEAIDGCLKRQADNEWQKIHWQTDATAALVQARRENKPIFIFVAVNQKRAHLAKNRSGDT